MIKYLETFTKVYFDYKKSLSIKVLQQVRIINLKRLISPIFITNKQSEKKLYSVYSILRIKVRVQKRCWEGRMMFFLSWLLAHKHFFYLNKHEETLFISYCSIENVTIIVWLLKDYYYCWFLDVFVDVIFINVASVLFMKINGFVFSCHVQRLKKNDNFIERFLDDLIDPKRF